jgi:predicted transcriptional regulator
MGGYDRSMRARWNETTAKILGALNEGEKTAEGIAHALKTDVSKVRSILRRLWEQKNVEREKRQQGTVVVDKDEGIERPRYVYLYSISEKGQARLAYIAESLKRRNRAAANRDR